MRKPIFSAALTVALAAPGAFAQGYDEEGEGGLPEGASTIAPEPGGSQSTGKASAPGTQHTVEKGDTLWDLTQKYLGSPWYWPKVWSYNPEIANPHWIYPGNEIRFYNQGEDAPGRVEAGADELDVDEGEMMDDRIQVTGQIGFRAKPGMAVVSPGFVTEDEVESSGTIVGSFAESIALTYPDHIYVNFEKAPRLGESYLVFRNEGAVTHPVTNNSIGFFTAVLAEVKVIRVDGDKQATVQIVKQYDEVRRGDWLGPAGEPVTRRVLARPNEKEVKDAYLVADARLYPTGMGEHQTVIMDKGSNDGVKVGATFTFWRQHDPLPPDALMQPTGIDDRFPREDIGQCVAYEVKKTATLCLITASIREFVRGERAEIRLPGSKPRASR